MFYNIANSYLHVYLDRNSKQKIRYGGSMIRELFAGKQTVSFTYITMNRGKKERSQVVYNYLRIINMLVMFTCKHHEMSLSFEDDRECLLDRINLSSE